MTTTVITCMINMESQLALLHNYSSSLQAQKYTHHYNKVSTYLLILKRHTIIVKVTSYILLAYYRRHLTNENSELIAD